MQKPSSQAHCPVAVSHCPWPEQVPPSPQVGCSATGAEGPPIPVIAGGGAGAFDLAAASSAAAFGLAGGGFPGATKLK